jgi:hypothetical protein
MICGRGNLGRGENAQTLVVHMAEMSHARVAGKYLDRGILRR